MAVIFADNPEYYFGLSSGVNAVAAGIWGQVASSPTITNAAPIGRSPATDTKIYAWQGTTGSQGMQKNFATTYGRLIAGYAVYNPTVPSTGNSLIGFLNSAAAQTDCRVSDVSGHMTITRAGTVLGTSTLTLSTGWHYVELDVTFATGATGSATLWVDGVAFLTLTTLQTSTTTALANQVFFGNATNFRDVYILDPSVSPNTAKLGDITVSVKYPTGAGVNGTWAVGPALFVIDSVAAGTGVYTGSGLTASALVGYDVQITGFANAANNGIFRVTANTTTTVTTNNSSSVVETKTGKGALSYYALTVAGAASGGVAAYTGAFPTGAVSNGWAGKKIAISGFIASSGINNGTFNCSLSSATSITLDNAAAVSETHLGSANLIVEVQDGISHLGTWPDGDVTYLYDSTLNDIVDLAHESLTLSGQIFSVINVGYMRKDDAGSRSAAMYTLSAGTPRVGTSQSLGGSYLYYMDFMDVDPATSAQWVASGFNAATFGVKQLT